MENITSIISFDEFYETLKPFAEILADDLKKNPFDGEVKQGADAFWNRRAVKLPNAFKLLTTAIALRAIDKAIDGVTARLFESERLARVRKKLSLSITDSSFVFRLHEVTSLALARDLPKGARRQAFADYARLLSLPHIARVIDVAVQHAPSVPMRQPQDPLLAPGGWSRKKTIGLSSPHLAIRLSPYRPSAR